MSKHRISKGLLKGCVVALGTAGFVVASTSQAQAALVSCPASFTTDGTAKVHDGGGAPNLTAASQCQYISPADNSNTASEANVNAAGFFGFSDWDATGVLQTNANAASGTWQIPAADLNFALYDYMITFKDGDGTNLISFLLNESYSQGGWDTPFTEPPFVLSGGSTSHNVSHLSIFRRLSGDDITIPEPATLLLMGVGLAAAASRMRRRTI